jgi:hypothetical protein
MAYAACLGDLTPEYLDTRVRPDVLAHPLFPVCYEWPLFLDPRCMPTDLPAEERVRGVHFTHDVTLHRPIRAGLELTTRATLVNVEARRSGAYQLSRLDTVDSNGDMVSTTWYGMLLRGVEVVGGDRTLDDAGPTLEAAGDSRSSGAPGADSARYRQLGVGGVSGRGRVLRWRGRASRADRRSLWRDGSDAIDAYAAHRSCAGRQRSIRGAGAGARPSGS